MVVGTVYGPSQIDALYEKDVQNALKISKQVCNFDELDEVRQRVLVQLCFNLGNRILGFKKMIAALNAKNYTLAAAFDVNIDDFNLDLLDAG